MIRLFAGIELPATIRQRLALMAGGIPEARWTEQSNYHLTLAFIGEVQEPQAAVIDEALENIRHKAFDVQVKGIGQFDRGGHTIIVWAGIAPNPDLTHLSDKVKTAISRSGSEIDRRKYTPHITLARIGHGSKQDRIFHFLADHSLFETAPFTVNEFCLYESLRGNGAPVYRPIRRYKLF